MRRSSSGRLSRYRKQAAFSFEWPVENHADRERSRASLRDPFQVTGTRQTSLARANPSVLTGGSSELSGGWSLKNAGSIFSSEARRADPLQVVLMPPDHNRQQYEGIPELLCSPRQKQQNREQQ